MTSMWRTCFRSLAILSLASLPATTAAETIKGVLVLNAAGDARPAKKLDASGVVVWLEPPTPAGQAAVAPKPSAVHQRNFSFVPHVTAVQVGTAVDFPNDDPIFHNVFSNFDGQVFDLQLYAPQTARRVVFRRPGIVHVFCNIHHSMSAIVAVVPTPYFAITDAAGRFEIDAPAGEYRLQVWHERAQPDVLSRLTQRVSVGTSPVVVPETQLVVSTEPLPPHKDKYGRDYATKNEERVFYQGARR